MDAQYLEPRGEIISSGDLELSKALELVHAVEVGAYTSLIECRRDSDTIEVVIFDTEVERPQKRANDIRRVERIAVEFESRDTTTPEVLALRSDFPLVPHLNLRIQEFPRSLCLFDEKYNDLKSRWTGVLLVNRIREWLALTTKGTLHGNGQPLEPLLFGSEWKLVIPSDILCRQDSLLYVLPVKSGKDRFTLIAEYFEDTYSGQQDLAYLATVVSCQPLQHGIIRQTPTNICELHKFLEYGNVDLVRELRKRLKEWKTHNEKLLFSISLFNIGLNNDSKNFILKTFISHRILLMPPINISQRSQPNTYSVTDSMNNEYILRKQGGRFNVYQEWILGRRLVLIVALPKTRYEGGAVEATDFRAFLTDKTIRDIGVELDAWEIREDGIGEVFSPDESKNGNEISLLMLDPVSAFSRSLAVKLSGSTEATECRIVAVGLGALGSQVFINLTRMGYGKWTLIDEDCLLPHNLARHALDATYVGSAKAEALASVANPMIEGEPIAEFIVTDILDSFQSEETNGKVENAFRDADIILDMSASIAVARHLANNVNSSARRISLFLNPSGTDIIILAEDIKREITLDCLEMQYYRLLYHEPDLRQHLMAEFDTVRYANSCRDVSRTIPQDFVALLSSIGSRALRKINSTDDAFIAIWHTEAEEMNVRKYGADVASIIRRKIGEWSLCTDRYVIDKVNELRETKLPNETGGVLLGSYDMERRVIYVVDVIPSPPDSIEWPTLYIRGCEGLRGQLEEVTQITSGRLEYIGEWHSHPPGCGSRPSSDDCQAFGWLREIMSTDGLPPLMLIVGALENYTFYIDCMG
jgi:integrative and conjugative element protein (TIGR02256 family)